MKKSTKLAKIILLIICFVFSFGLVLPSFADSSFEGDPCASGVPAEVKAASGCEGEGSNQLVPVIQGILNAIIAVSGIVAVVYVVIGGITYMTSAGDPGKVKKARDTILYAVIGLAVCALAFVIVNFTISKIQGQGQEQGQEQE